MPLGFTRINNKRSVPNKNIVFIKPLPGPTESTAKDFLERIAAQCLPITNKHCLSVASLDEYEPNREFWGRNFNNGEVIQLVLRSPSTGRWLPFKFVQMVMMHELAHCKQMNHSGAFWKVRNEYSNHMRELWSKGYTGEGLWGRGVLLENGAFAREDLGEGEVLPEHMCGGTFRSRGGRKRKAKPKITYKERQERRIKRKFGTNGITLGADEETKVKLEGKKPAGKPRVAGSARGRELRAAAALARFEVKPKEEELVTDSETEGDMEDDVLIKAEPDDAVDIDGKRLLGWVKVCEDENEEDNNVKNEMRELEDIKDHPSSSSSSKTSLQPQAHSTLSVSQASKRTNSLTTHPNSNTANSTTSRVPKRNSTLTTREDISEPPSIPRFDPKNPQILCPICSVSNEPTTLTCTVCSHVLKPDFIPDSWRCRGSTCKDSAYINAGDVGICGVCGTRKFSD
ncbi:Uncharacterized protein BP5553_07874 [Venustampulla echinocandica]|uniref:WLM domain-containing protein n=1 Tax=Venustampulla echinocandica TaxID=2656787 RepID=A0A370THS3_9HELO|nr:Uncharacterized protein BP5553_07874 [Venustampulla echinocandica]RDL34746.1 Uncharacterized protein BP5553_07874 [Venustampulla echinocandica]